MMSNTHLNVGGYFPHGGLPAYGACRVLGARFPRFKVRLQLTDGARCRSPNAVRRSDVGISDQPRNALSKITAGASQGSAVICPGKEISHADEPQPKLAATCKRSRCWQHLNQLILTRTQ
jgi:hypothetical protein